MLDAHCATLGCAWPLPTVGPFSPETALPWGRARLAHHRHALHDVRVRGLAADSKIQTLTLRTALPQTRARLRRHGHALRDVRVRGLAAYCEPTP